MSAVSALAGIAVAFLSVSPSAEAELAEVTSIETPAGSLPAEEGPGENDDVPEGLTTSDWGQIRQEYERHRHSVVPDGEGYKSRNHGQQWLIRFDGRGFSVQPDQGGWNWGLELVSYGFGGAERVVEGKATMSADKNRLTYAWDETVEEWFVNDTRGLEHGFTFMKRPAGEGGRLELRLAVRGGLRAEAANSHAVRFVDEDAAAVVNYAGLKVWDADGRSLSARLDATPAGQVRVVVDDRGAKYPITVDPLAQQTYLKASNTGAGDLFGESVAVSGDTVVVGASDEDSNGVGVNPPSQADNSLVQSGAVYVFVRTGGVWSQQAYLKASNTGFGDQFGESVAVSGDTVVVGARFEDSNGVGVNPPSQADNSLISSGAAYVFVRTAGVWSQQAYLKASNTDSLKDRGDFFGRSVDVSGDTVVVGAYHEDSNGVGVNPPSQADNSLPDSGAAYIFVRTAGVWSQQAYLKASNTGPSDIFGESVAVSGDTVVVGARFEDSNGVGVNPPSQADNSLPFSGAAYVFVRTAGVWSQQAYLKASNTGFGDDFGFSVAVSGDTVVVGANQEDSNGVGVNPPSQADNSRTESGAAYVFVRAAGVWSQLAYLKASNTDTIDRFGWAVAVSGDMVVVAATFEASNGMGVNPPSQADNSSSSGAAYVFTGIGLQITGVLDAASFQALISPGSIVSVFGNFVETTATASSIPLGENLGGVSVTFNDIPGALFGVFDGDFDQSNVQVPWNVDVSSGKVEIKVHWKDETSEVWSDPFEVDAASASPGIYMFPPSTTQAIVTNFKQEGDDVIAGSWAQAPGSIDPITGQPAAIGGVVTIWCNGLGPVSPGPPTGDIPPAGTVPVTDKTVHVFVGGVEAQVLGSVLQPTSVGLNQINIIIPHGVMPGDAVPIVIEVECPDGTKLRSREDVTIAVRVAP